MASRFTDVVWPGWEVVRKLGVGSFGGVYEIQRTLPDGQVEKGALKKLTLPRNPDEIEELRSNQFDEASPFSRRLLYYALPALFCFSFRERNPFPHPRQQSSRWQQRPQKKRLCQRQP